MTALHDTPATVLTWTEAFQKWRTRHALTQEDAARECDVTLSCWRNWEAHRSNGPSLDTLVKLERMYPGLFRAVQQCAA